MRRNRPATLGFAKGGNFSCEIRCLGDGYITAASTLPYDAFGFVFAHCKITGVAPAIRTYLGRPWRACASVIFLNTEMSAVVYPVGWHNWDRPDREKTARYTEYNSYGAGANRVTRVRWARVGNENDAAGISVEAVLGGRDHWAPSAR